MPNHMVQLPPLLLMTARSHLCFSYSSVTHESSKVNSAYLTGTKAYLTGTNNPLFLLGYSHISKTNGS